MAATSSTLGSVIVSSSNLSIDSSGNLDLADNISISGKITYSNVYSQLSDLPNASTHHGMFAHVHGTGKAYYAHGGNWIELVHATNSDASGFSFVVDEDSFSSDSASRVPTQQSVKAYVSTNYAPLSGPSLVGVPTAPTADTSTDTTQIATTEFVQNRVDALTSDDVGQGSSNLYTTAATTRTHFTYGNGISLSSSGELSITQSEIDTDSISEGSNNLFFTDARALAAIGDGDITNANLENSTMTVGGVTLTLGSTDATPAFNLADATNLPTTALTGNVAHSQIAANIPNTSLDNSSVSLGGVSIALGETDATPAFNLVDATNYPASSLTGTVTNAQLAGSIANDKLANSSVSLGGVSADLGGSDATPAFDLSDATNYPTSSLTEQSRTQLAGSIANDKLANSF